MPRRCVFPASRSFAVPAGVIASLSSTGPRPFVSLCGAGAAYIAVYLCALAFTPGAGGPIEKVKRVLLGHAHAAAA